MVEILVANTDVKESRSSLSKQRTLFETTGVLLKFPPEEAPYTGTNEKKFLKRRVGKSLFTDKHVTLGNMRQTATRVV